MKITFYVLFISLLVLAGTLAQAQTTFTVTTTNDAGAGSLRQAMLNVAASASAGPFAITTPSPHTGQTTWVFIPLRYSF